MRVLEISGPAIDRVRLFIDASMLIAGQAYSRPDPTGRPMLTEEVFSDYRVVNGVRVPFEAQLLQNGQPILKRTLTNVAINGPVSDTLFASRCETAFVTLLGSLPVRVRFGFVRGSEFAFERVPRPGTSNPEPGTRNAEPEPNLNTN